MELEETGQRRSGIFCYFGGATINKVIINNGTYNPTVTENHYYGSSEKKKNTEYNDEQIARAIKSINGKQNVLNNYQMWLGVCCLLSNKYGFPRNLEKCCDRIMNLPYEGGSLELECKYESIRKFAYMKFVNENVDDWETYIPKDDEKKLFNGCHDVAKQLEIALKREGL
jgi:hypothetical protein